LGHGSVEQEKFMADDLMPYQIIQSMVEVRKTWTDEEVLSDLTSVPPLADEDDPWWDDEESETIAYRYIALWNVAAIRKLKAALPLILDRACNGDPGEIMRGVFHSLEGIVAPNYVELFEPCVAATNSPRTGTRFWAVQQLRRLGDPRAIPTFKQLLSDPAESVRDAAEDGLNALQSK
jgi:HEAT repeat protein